MRNNRTKSDDSNDSGTTDTDRSDRSDRSDNDDETPEKGEKSKCRSEKRSSHGNLTPPLELQIFRKSSDKLPSNKRMEAGIVDTGCTTSCIPLALAKSHNLKITKVDKDEPDMKTYNGLGMKIVRRTKLYMKIKTRRGFTSKKLLHALFVDHS